MAATRVLSLLSFYMPNKIRDLYPRSVLTPGGGILLNTGYECGEMETLGEE